MNKHENLSRISYNKKADDYENTFDGRFTFKFKELLLQTVVIPDGGKLLDIACGNGRLLKMLSQSFRFSGYGADISEKMIDNARRLNPSMVFEVASCNVLPFADAFFDVATVCAAFHHFPNISSFAKEVGRVLKPGGMLYIAEVYYPAFIRTILNPFVKLSKAGDVKFYAPEEITELFLITGFTNQVLKKEGCVQIVGVQKR
jgi:ubiquinone/menaquinone biosynthesis C-methylase UbiE